MIGLGSIGGVAAGCLRAADRHDVVACVRQPLERLMLERPEGTIEVELRTMTDSAAAAPVDWVLLCTKSQDTPSAAPWLARLCRPSTRVAVLQNSVDHISRVSPLIAGATVVPTVVYYNGDRLATDRVRLRHVQGPDLAVPDDAAGHAFASLLEGSGLAVSPNADFTPLLWGKLLINSVANPLTALTRQRQMVLRRDDMRMLCLAVLEEAAAVGRAEGARLGPDAPERRVAALFSAASPGGSANVSLTTRSTSAVGNGGNPGFLVLPRSSPETPSCMKRSCQRHTQGFETPARRIISAVPHSSAVAKMICACQTCFCRLFRSATTAANRSRSAALTPMLILSRMPHHDTRCATLESYDCVIPLVTSGDQSSITSQPNQQCIIGH